MKVLVLTTAINRSGLHLQTFEGYKNFLSGKTNIHWIVNIDTVAELEEDGIVTETNIVDMFDDARNFHFEFVRNRDGNFNRAVRTLLRKSKKYLNKVDWVLWLEDDWMYDLRYIVRIDQVLDGFDTDINLKEKFCLTSVSKGLPYAQFMELSPRIWSVPMFKAFIDVFDNNDNQTGSPELIAQKNFRRSLMRVNPKGKRTFKMQYPIFKDVGREYMESLGLKKGDKRRQNHGTNMYRKI